MAYREIVTKAIIAKCKKKYHSDYTVLADNTPTTILGCWIINHQFKASANENIVNITGSYDLNIWYSYDNDTKTAVLNKNIPYEETEEINIDNKNVSNTSVLVRALMQPTCTKATSEGNNINVTVEKELGIELIGDTNVKISSVDSADDDWEDLSEKDTIDKINPDYLKEH